MRVPSLGYDDIVEWRVSAAEARETDFDDHTGIGVGDLALRAGQLNAFSSSQDIYRRVSIEMVSGGFSVGGWFRRADQSEETEAPTPECSQVRSGSSCRAGDVSPPLTHTTISS